MTLISRLVFFSEKKTTKKSSEKISINEISIVIPVKDNQKGINSYLSNFFLSHNKVKYPKEIIIVDNNSNPAIEIGDQYKQYEVPIKLLSCQKKGPAAARNIGGHEAKGKWILFNDSDCVPTDTLLTGYLHSDNGSVAYAGNVKALKQDRLSQYYESQEILIPLKTYNNRGAFVPQYLITANCLVWKRAFIEIGGFNESIQIAGGEDIDFGLRVSQIGDLNYAFSSISLHNFNDGLIGFCRRFKRYGYGNRLIEEIWKTDMKPALFRPNKRTIFNEFIAKLQYLFLLIGYLKSSSR